MKINILAILVLMILAGEVYSQEYIEADKDYIQEVLQERKEKDAKFKDEVNSPLTKKQRKKFSGVSYYDVDEEYRVNAIFKEHANKEMFLMPTSTERLPQYNRYGQITFDLKGETFVLQVYQNVELSKKPGYEKYLFIPFTDKSNGFGSYGGGRYLDVQIPDSDALILDFNSCYNPYCSYNSNYSCPIPPKENDIEMMILAGEKSFNDH